jgi:hypothetical protein
VPDDDLVDRLNRWALSMPGMPEAIEHLVCGGYLDDDRFVSECVVDMDGADVAYVDWVVVQEMMATSFTHDECQGLAAAMAMAHSSMPDARRWSLAASETGVRL